MLSPVHRQPLPPLVVFPCQFLGNDSRISHLTPVADKTIQTPGHMSLDKTDKPQDVKNVTAGSDLRRIPGETISKDNPIQSSRDPTLFAPLFDLRGRQFLGCAGC
jgi:hypothetical protein